MDNNNLNNNSSNNQEELEQISIWWNTDNNLSQIEKKVKIDPVKMIKGLLILLILWWVSFAGYKYYVEKNNLSIKEDESSYTSNVKPWRETSNTSSGSEKTNNSEVDVFSNESSNSWTVKEETKISSGESLETNSNSWIVNSSINTELSGAVTTSNTGSLESTWNTTEVNELDWFLQGLNSENTIKKEEPPVENTTSELDEYLKLQN